MPDDRESDDSGSQNPERGVRFVDTDLSINPSQKATEEGFANTADKYYKDMQSIHGDMVRDLVFGVLFCLQNSLGQSCAYVTIAPEKAWRSIQTKRECYNCLLVQEIP